MATGKSGRIKLATGRVEATMVTPPGGTVSLSQTLIKLNVLGGIVGDKHQAGRVVDAREDILRQELGIPKGTPIANVRQVSAICADDLARTSAVMATPTPIPYGLLAENLVLSGIPNLTQVPAGALLTFTPSNLADYPAATRAVVAVWGENRPCRAIQDNIEAYFGAEGESYQPSVPFAKAAEHRRGIVGFVYMAGIIEAFDRVTIWQEGSK